MADTVRIIDEKQGLIRSADAGVLAPVQTTGEKNLDKIDYLKVRADDTALDTNQRQVELIACNDDATVTGTFLKLGGTGTGMIILPKIATAARPTATAALNGAMYYDTTDHKVRVCANGTWTVVGTQT